MEEMHGSKIPFCWTYDILKVLDDILLKYISLCIFKYRGLKSLSSTFKCIDVHVFNQGHEKLSNG